ncbi:hypothetical protein QJQ45_025765 [Haematococcus lacustris]|nr:hypothetical protein QJQ45_025765 [Haematococcus lacustris]
MGCGASTTMGRGASTIRTTLTRVAKKEAISAAKAVGSDIAAQNKQAEAESSASQQVKTDFAAPEQEQEEACSRAQNLLEGVLGDEASLADLDKEVDLALSTVSKLLDNPQGAVDLQALKLPNRSSAERKLAQLSVLGQVVVDLAAASVAALPFGAPVAAAIGGIYARATQAAKNSANCARLLALVQQCDRQLAKLMCGVKRQQGGHKVPAEAKQGLRTMAELLVKAGRVMASYTGRGFLMRAVTSTSDKATFASLEAQIRAAMQVCGGAGAGSPGPGCLVPHLCWALACWLQGACFAMTVELVITQGPYSDEWAAFRAAVCEAAGLPENKVQHALLQLQSFQPAVLRSIVEQHCGLADRLMAVELSDIKAGMAQLGSELAKLHQSQDKAAARGPAALPKYLQTWWNNSVGELEMRVANNGFVTQLVTWFSQAGWVRQGAVHSSAGHDDLLQARLAAYDQKLRTEGKLPLLPHQQHAFLHFVIVPLADVDKDGFVTRSELLRLQQLGVCYAEQALVDAPESLPQLLSAVFLGHDRDMLAKELVMQGADVMATVRDKLQARCAHAAAHLPALADVAEVIRGYRIAQLLDEYHSGSRQWMYTRVNDWLNASSSSSPGGAATASRLFLLLADAGMGKSVFSAVMHTKLVVRGNKDSGLVMAHHFFTVGQARSQGRTMLLCLAQQLAEKLPGLAELLLPVVEQHGNASQLSLQDTFTSFLLEPLLALDKALLPEAPRPFVLLLLDALDEADDCGKGWQPVTALIAKEFLRLPVWVRVLLTGRPQVEAAFAAWKPEWIKPGDKQNQADMFDLLHRRLGQAQLVADSDLDAAAQLMLRKSSGQFIYTKYAFDDLAEQESWTLHEMEERLPSGLEGMYRRVLSTLEEALQTERPDLLELLRTRLLPVLVACLEPLTVQELAWATGCEADTGKVQQLVGLLANLFPCRAGGSDQQERVAPYHKSVLDWLTSAAGMSAGQFHVSTQQGHRLLASACLQQAIQCVVHSQPGSPKTCTDDVPGPNLRYTLRHAVAHACLSGEAEVLQTLLLEFGFWQAAYTAGHGPDVLRDLLSLCQQAPAASKPVVHDVTRWLRMSSSTLVKHPWAVWQLARDSPHNSLVAKQAASLPIQPVATLLTKEDSWTACLTVLTGHTSNVKSVATDGMVIASGSADNTVRVWDMAAGSCTHTLEGHTSCIAGVTLSPDGKVLVSGSDDKTIRWVYKHQGTPYVHPIPNLLHWTPPPSMLTSLYDGVVVWKARAHKIRCSSLSLLRVSSLRYAMAENMRSAERGTITIASSASLPYSETLLAQALPQLADPHAWAVCSIMHDFSKLGLLHGKGFTAEGVWLQGSACVWRCPHASKWVWDMAAGSCTHTLEGHTSCVTSVTLSPDGKVLVSGSRDNTIRVWDMASGSCTYTMEGHTDCVNGVTLSPDGKVLVSGSGDNTIRVWDMAAGSCTHTLEGHTSCIAGVTLSPDGKVLVSGSDDKTIRWVYKHQCTPYVHPIPNLLHWTPPPSMLTSLYDSAGGTRQPPIAALHASPSRVALELTGLSPFQTPSLCPSLKRNSDMARSQRGYEATEASQRKGPFGNESQASKPSFWFRSVWDMAAGSCTHTLEGHTDCVNGVTLSPDGKVLVSGSEDKTIRVWNMATGSCTHTLDGHTKQVTSVTLSPNGKVLVSGSRDNTIRVWDVANGNCTHTLEGHTDCVNGVTLSPDGKVLVSGSRDNTIRVWDMAAGSCTHTLEGHTSCIAGVTLSPDGKVLVSGSEDKTIRVWDMAAGSCTHTLEGHTSCVTSVTLSPDGKVLVSGSRDNTIRVWDMANGSCTHTLEGHTSCIAGVTMSPDGKVLVSGSDDKTIRVWDMATGSCTHTLEGHTDCVTSVTLSPDGKVLVSGSYDNTIRVWDMATGSCTHTLEGHTSWITSVTLSPDGKVLVSGFDNKTIRVWDVAAGSCTHTLEGHTDCVNGVTLSPDGKVLVSGSRDNTIRVWDLVKGICKVTLEGHDEMDYELTFSTDGRVLTAWYKDSIRVWPLDDEGPDQALPPSAVVQCKDGVMVEVMRSSDLQLLGAMVLPQACELHTLCITGDRLAVFAAGRLLVYQLNIAV